MRLSNTQKFLLHFFLITSLTLLLKPNANAQAIQSTVFAYNDYGHNRHLSGEPGDEPIYIRADVNIHDEELTDVRVMPTTNFHHVSENLKPFPYRLIKSYKKFYPTHSIMPIMSVDLKHSARLTFKLFKLVIVPLWQSK